MTPKRKTLPDILKSSSDHQKAIEMGDEHYMAWLKDRNVVDHFKDKTNEEINAILRSSAFEYAVCFENILGDFNLATGIRNANAFNAREVFYVGNKRIDRRGALGCYKYCDLKWLPTVDDIKALQDRYTFVGIDNIAGSVPLSSYKWKPNTMMVFGEEGCGISPVMREMCKEIVEIEQFGSVRSLNVGVASGIIMHSFVSQMRNK